MTAPKVITEAYLQRRREQDRARYERARAAKGGKSRAEWLAFVREQAEKTRAARTPIVIQPSVAKRRAMQVNTGPGQSIDEFLAAGGRIEVLPGIKATPPGAMPARVWPKAGAWA